MIRTLHLTTLMANSVCPSGRCVLHEKALDFLVANLVLWRPTLIEGPRRELWDSVAVSVFVLQLWPDLLLSALLRRLLSPTLLRPSGLLLRTTPLLRLRILSTLLSTPLLGISTRLVRLRWLVRLLGNLQVNTAIESSGQGLEGIPALGAALINGSFV